MTDHELLHPDAVPVHKQHLEADEDTDFICPGVPTSIARSTVLMSLIYNRIWSTLSEHMQYNCLCGTVLMRLFLCNDFLHNVGAMLGVGCVGHVASLVCLT